MSIRVEYTCDYCGKAKFADDFFDISFGSDGEVTIEDKLPHMWSSHNDYCGGNVIECPECFVETKARRNGIGE